MATGAGQKTTLSAQVPVELRDGLERLATRADRSLSAEVRRAISGHLERELPRNVVSASPSGRVDTGGGASVSIEAA